MLSQKFWYIKTSLKSVIIHNITQLRQEHLNSALAFDKSMTNIRLAKIEDCNACSKLSEIKELAAADGSFISENYFKKNVDDDEMFFVAEDNNQIVGYILGEPLKDNLAFLSLLTIDKSQRGKGLGKQLIVKFEEQCRNKKLNPIIFYAPKFNENTIAFYKKQGYMQGKDHVQFMKII